MKIHHFSETLPKNKTKQKQKPKTKPKKTKKQATSLVFVLWFGVFMCTLSFCSAMAFCYFDKAHEEEVCGGEKGGRERERRGREMWGKDERED